MTGNVFEDGKPFSAAALNSMKDAHANRGVLEGLELSPGEGDFEVDVSSGEIAVGETTIDVDADTVEHAEAGESDRIDLVTADTGGNLNVVTGEEAEEDGQPMAPAIPEDEVLVGLVYVPGGSDGIDGGDLWNEYRTVLADYAVEDASVEFESVEVSEGLVVPTGDWED